MDEIGGPEVLVARETPDPVPGPGEVLVDVRHVSITFVETQVRAGRGPFPATPPVIPGNGVGGTVPAQGGRRVVTTTGGSGGYAEKVAVSEAALIEVPDAVPLDTATALLADGRTATLLARTVAARPGERVLVLAAAGGVGSLLVQLVGAAGATVIGTAGGADKVAVVEAEEVHDHRVAGWADAIDAVDVVLDGVGGDVGRAAFEKIRTGGRVLRFGMASGSFTSITDEEAAERDIALLDTGRPTPEEISDLTREALAAAARGELHPRIGARRPLAEAAEAHRAIESRQVVGKTLLDV